MKKFLEEFKAFALKGNMIDLAVGMIIGSAFTSIVNSGIKYFHWKDRFFQHVYCLRRQQISNTGSSQ